MSPIKVNTSHYLIKLRSRLWTSHWKVLFASFIVMLISTFLYEHSCRRKILLLFIYLFRSLYQFRRIKVTLIYVIAIATKLLKKIFLPMGWCWCRRFINMLFNMFKMVKLIFLFIRFRAADVTLFNTVIVTVNKLLKNFIASTVLMFTPTFLISRFSTKAFL